MWHEPQSISPKRAVVMRVFARYASYGFSLTYWESCALCALMQAGGLSLGLTFEPGPRGLGSQGVIRVLEHLEGVCFEGFLAHKLDRPFVVDDFALRQGRLVLKAHKQHREFVLTMAKVLHGFESPMGLWLLSSCWWLLVEEQMPWPRVREALSNPRPTQGIVANPEHLDAAHDRLHEMSLLFD